MNEQQTNIVLLGLVGSLIILIVFCACKRRLGFYSKSIRKTCCRFWCCCKKEEYQPLNTGKPAIGKNWEMPKQDESVV